MKEIRRIIKESQEAIEEATNAYAIREIKISAYNEIAREIERIDKAKEETEAEIKALIDEERMLNEHDDSIVYRGRGE